MVLDSGGVGRMGIHDDGILCDREVWDKGNGWDPEFHRASDSLPTAVCALGIWNRQQKVATTMKLEKNEQIPLYCPLHDVLRMPSLQMASEAWRLEK